MRRPCLATPTASCTQLAEPGKARCAECQRHVWRTASHARGPRPHYQGTWPTLTHMARHYHLATVGPVCPGWHTPPHTVPPHQLTTDHVAPRTLAHGVRVLCQRCNSARREREDETNEQLEQVAILDVDGQHIPLMR